MVVITLDRPDRRNAVDHDTLLALLEAQSAHRDAWVVVLTGAAGLLRRRRSAGVREDVFSADLRRVLQGFTAWPCPVVAA
ncbi:MAG: hypothetical protein R2697_12785 [Ilumatobacteraceae bacterium]